MYKYIKSDSKNGVNNRGYKYEHIVIAEKMLGFEFLNGETVHHIDNNKNNNSEENLMVIKTKADHTAFHSGNSVILQDDGTYISTRKTNACFDCGKSILNTSYRCIECAKAFSRKNIPDKEILENLLESNSMSAIGRMYSVSCNAVKKWRNLYKI